MVFTGICPYIYIFSKYEGAFHRMTNPFQKCKIIDCVRPAPSTADHSMKY